ncbi:hypothetical protein QFC20_006367 [Naganishia adeliensis]|uniref:Uncharacterized protein n=1 Tax=Naganishia adeliensis TaxID=92952 RepID=A0ACC2VC58_9TREE|nr:hypothetical protein QFC20_006367 [Naganishia adeliensis]
MPTTPITHSHSPPPDSSAAGDQSSLFSIIDREHVVALNAQGGEESGKNVIKPWDQREDETLVLTHPFAPVPFTAQVKLRSITIKSGPGGHTPVKAVLVSPEIKESVAYNASDHFNSVNDRKPVEEINLVAQKEGVEYAVRPSKFSAVRSLQIYFPANVSGGDDEETSRIYYVGLKGEWTQITKNPDGVIVYEAQANPSDHKVKGVADMQGSGLGM